jgi:FMNH2-dependent dimethyl sulfone monooxygenase
VSIDVHTEKTDPLKFAYWVPNVSGGLVTSNIEMRTNFGFDYNKELAVLAENNGFEYALSQVRYASSYGAAQQHDPAAFSLGLLMATERLKLIVAAHPGLWHPAILAKFGISADLMSHGRMAVNIVSGWFKDEFTGLGEPWLEHDERYRRTEEFIRVLRGLWTTPNFNLNGDFYRIHDFSLRPQPYDVPGRAHPEIFQGGNSTAARRMAGRVSDWYFSNGKDYDGFSEQVSDVRGYARENGRDVNIGLNAFVIARDTEKEAKDTLREIIEKADVESVEGFRQQVKNAGQATKDGKGMWADSEFADLVQYNDGFKTGLIGTPEQIAHRIVEYKKLGADLLLCGFLHYLEDVEYFGKHVMPLVREIEADQAAQPVAAGGVR